MKPQTNSLIIMLLMLMFKTVKSDAINALPGCPETCGGISIPYPFGIGSSCSLSGFNLSCNMTSNPPGPYLYDIAVLNISLSSGQARVNNRISSQCYNASYNNVSYNNYQLNITNSPFLFNDEKNKFIVIGCDILAYIQFAEGTDDSWGVCISGCSSPREIVKESCHGSGCCQASIPKGINYYWVGFSEGFNNSRVYDFSRCSYAVLTEADTFNFSSDYITTEKLYEQQMPVILDWVIGNTTCDVAQANRSSYACNNSHSDCVNSTNGSGYFCRCSNGYEGNPYLSEGCRDIDECAIGKPCFKSRKCHNTQGAYWCSCPAWHRRLKHSTTEECELNWPIFVGIGTGSVFLSFVGLFMFVASQRRNLSKVKEKYFQQHGGWILLQEIKSNLGLSFTIFTKQQLEQSTENFDSSNIIGQGGQGTVYKGTVKDRLVAIKKCNIIGESKKKEFGKEILILSEISHKNIVKLLGCCLEVEVPMLVYEFISNGTLFHQIHHRRNGSSMTLGTRLRIAHESAEALAYLHYAASPPIFHGDVKSLNILLDENYTAKVSDFGASILAPTDESQFVTVVQGTCGYLDPQYMQTCQLTDKSDVYSFGVVLLELLTSMPVIDFGAAEEINLSSRFLSAMNENNMQELLDDQIKTDEDMELIFRVAELAKECLNMTGENRPTMKEVAEELDRIRKLKIHPWAQTNPEEIETLLGGESSTHVARTTGNLSIEREALQSMALGR